MAKTFAQELASSIARSDLVSYYEWGLHSFIPAGRYNPCWFVMFRNDNGDECRVTVEDIPGETPEKPAPSGTSGESVDGTTGDTGGPTDDAGQDRV